MYNQSHNVPNVTLTSLSGKNLDFRIANSCMAYSWIDSLPDISTDIVSVINMKSAINMNVINLNNNLS